MNISIRTLDLTILNTSPPYQRPLDDGRVKRYAEKFDERRFGVPEVSRRLEGEDFVYAVIDGQHRVEAAKLSGRKKAKCRLHDGLTYEEEVALYRATNNERKRLERIDDFKAALEQKDPDALALNEMVNAAGFLIGRGGGPNRLAAVGELFKMYRLNESLITESLGVCRVWLDHLDHGSSLTAEIIGGIHLILHEHPGIDRKRLNVVLSKKAPRWWSAEADMATNSDRRAARMATLVERQYNKGLKSENKKLIPANF